MKEFDFELMSKRLKKIRKQSGLTQAEVGRHFGVTKQAVCWMENKPQVLTIERINSLAELYGCRPTDFFAESECN